MSNTFTIIRKTVITSFKEAKIKDYFVSLLFYSLQYLYFVFFMTSMTLILKCKNLNNKLYYIGMCLCLYVFACA